MPLPGTLKLSMRLTLLFTLCMWLASVDSPAPYHCWPAGKWSVGVPVLHVSHSPEPAVLPRQGTAPALRLVCDTSLLRWWASNLPCHHWGDVLRRRAPQQTLWRLVRLPGQDVTLQIHASILALLLYISALLFQLAVSLSSSGEWG